MVGTGWDWLVIAIVLRCAYCLFFIVHDTSYSFEYNNTFKLGSGEEYVVDPNSLEVE